MDMKQIAQQLGVEEYPENFDVIYAQLADATAPACDLELINEAQQKYEAFGRYYDIVREGAQQINADPAYSAWVKTVTEYMRDEKWGNYRDIPVPPLDGTPKRDMAMLAAMIPFIPSAAAQYRKGGFTEEQIAGYLQGYAHCLGSTKIRTGYVGLDITYFRWLHHFAFAEIFRVHGIQFEFAKLKKQAIYLRDKENGLVIPVMTEGLVHASGRHLVGAGGYEDTEGAFEPTFIENEDSFIGHGVFDAVISTEPQVFPKSQWECLARPGDKCLAMHLPRGADITREHIQLACDAAREIVRKSYPEYADVQIQGISWLLDPGLEKFLSADSKIIRFGRMFARYPGKNPGRAANSFVFPGKYERDEDLPEDTSLQRGLKQHYLNGGYTYAYYGILVL